MNNENNGKNRMWRDAPAALCEFVGVDPARRLAQVERERDEARDALSEIAFYLSVGLGDETTTPQQYKERILDGIKMLTDPIMALWKQAERERDEAREALRNLTQ